MSTKKKWPVFVLVVLVLTFLALSFLPGEAAGERPFPGNHPPECFPMASFIPGTWGMSCIDKDNNIASVSVVTDYKYSLNWNQSRADIVVFTGSTEKQPAPQIVWEVCDKAGACVGGAYP